MSATLLSICQDAMAGVLNFNSQNQISTIINNTDPEAILLLSCATQVGRELVRGYDWQQLKKSYTFSTIANQEGYSIPSDIQKYVNLSMWDASDHWPLIQASNVAWAELKNGIVVSGIRFYFSVFGNLFNLNPIPDTTLFNIAFDYYSKNYCTDANGNAQSDWAADTDIPVLDSDLMTLGIRYKFKARHGLPYAEEKGDYLQAIKDLLAGNTPKSIIDVGRLPNRNWPINVPDGGWNI